MLRPPPRPGGVWSKSAPNLDKSRIVLSKPTHDIGNTSSSNNNKCDLKERNDSTSRIFNKLITAFNLHEFKPFALRSARSNTNLRRSSLNKAHLSRSIGNISESHYDTVFNTDSYVIARGVNTDEVDSFTREYADIRIRDDNDTVGLLNNS